MSSEWKSATLGETCLKITDGAHNSPASVTDGKPMASVKDLTRFGVNLKSARLISQEDFELLVKQGCKPSLGDVLIAKDGNSALDTVCSVDSELDAVLLSSVAILRPNPELLDSHFLKFYLSSPDVIDYLKANFISGAAIPRVVLRDFKKAEINLPPLGEQKKIASVFQALDDRIALLRETNATLEAIAQALFKSWFVDFDPVHANAGTQAPSLPPEIQALFPATFTDSPQGPIPEGWNIGFVGDFAEQKKGSVNPLSQPETLFEHFSLPAFDNQQAPVLELGKEIKSNKTPLPKKAVLLSKLNPHIPRLWLPIEYGDTAVCSTEFLAYSPKGASSTEFIYCAFSSEKFTTHLCQLVTGTSNSHQRVKPDQVLLIETVLPPDEIFKQFELITNPIFAQVHKNRLQSQTLATMRDTLLPRLISGQLRLPEAEQAVAAITD